MLASFNRQDQGGPQLSGTDVLQGEFRCHECRAVMHDLGTGCVQWRCINRDCAQCAIDTKKARPMNSHADIAVACLVLVIVSWVLSLHPLVIGGFGGACLLACFQWIYDVTDEPFDVDVGEGD